MRHFSVQPQRPLSPLPQSWRLEVSGCDRRSRIGFHEPLCAGAVFADINGDGYLDLLVTYAGKGAKVFLNDGNGHFRDAELAELASDSSSTSIALGDMNGDGYLDLYISNYGKSLQMNGASIETKMVAGKEVVVGRYRHRLEIADGKLIEHGEPDLFFINDGHGHFEKKSWTDGTFLDDSDARLAQPALGPWPDRPAFVTSTATANRTFTSATTCRTQTDFGSVMVRRISNRFPVKPFAACRSRR